jgi:hypothetical protein
MKEETYVKFSGKSLLKEKIKVDEEVKFEVSGIVAHINRNGTWVIRVFESKKL